MLEVTRFTVENLTSGCITDKTDPCFGYALRSDQSGVIVKEAVFEVNGWSVRTTAQTGICYEGSQLDPFQKYTVSLRVTDNKGETASAVTEFETGRMNTAWTGKWISDSQYVFKEKKVS